MKVLVTFLLCLLLVYRGIAQKVAAEAALPAVNKNGFYRIPISPEFVSYLNHSFSNIRVYDQDGHEVPYLLDEEVPSFSSTTFVEYSIIENTSTPKCCTKVTFHNKEKKTINNISLVIRNAETLKEATLLGSDDQKKWYSLKEHFYLSSIEAADKTYEVRVVDFPLNNYPFISLNINDSVTAPLNIIKAGYYETSEVSGNYSLISPTSFSVEENTKEKISRLKITFDSDKIVDKLEFTISGAPFYHRYASVTVPEQIKNRKGKIISTSSFIQDLEFTSTHQASYRIRSIKTKEIDIEIRNEDNAPLKVDSVRALQLNRYIEVYLEQSKQYSIKIGDLSQDAPSYDIGYFRDSIPSKPPLLIPQKLVAASIAPPTPTTIFTSKLFIWVAIIVVVAGLAYMSFKLVNEAGLKEKS